MMPKTLVLGDLHLEDKYPGYLEAQRKCIENIVHKEKPEVIVFLGDVFQFRKPDPETLLEFDELLRNILETLGVISIYILRGNHDSSTKGDNFITALSLFNGGRVEVITSTKYVMDLNYLFIPHYENELHILSHINQFRKMNLINNNTIIFGHFGFQGCLNTAGEEDFQLTPDMFDCKTIIGHIHKPGKMGNITVLGTPYSTGFQEVDYHHQYGIIDRNGNLDLRPITHGPRYLVYPLEALESNKEFICDHQHFTILRVLLSKLDGYNTIDLRKKLLDEYKVKYVDVKYLPFIDDKVDQSSYYTPSTLTELTDEIIDKYIAEQKTSIPEAEIRKGLEILKNETQKDLH